jgi:long-chain fatty acid transport protein
MISLHRRFVLVVCLAAAGQAGATNGMRMPGFGAVQGSMGGASTAAPLDGCTLMTNPAGLSELGARIDLSGSYFKPTVDYTATESQLPPGYTGAVVAQPGVQLDSKRGASPIPSLAGVFPLGRGFTFGIGAFAVAGMGVDYAQNLYGGTTTTSYLQARVVPALAWKPGGDFSVGVGLNVMVAQMQWDVAKGFGQMPHDTATSMGLGATIGLRYAPMKLLAIGLAYETPSKFQDFSFDIAAHQGVNPATFQPVQFAAGTDKLTFNQPMSATLGLAVTPAEVLLIAVDAQWINWSDTNGVNKPAFSSDANATGAMPWNLAWKDQWVFKVGAQVAVTPGLKIRAGYNYGRMPLQSSRAFENLAFPALSEHHFALGAGYEIGQFTVNLGGTYSPRSTISGSNADYPAQGGQAIASYTTGMSQLTLDLGLGYRL